MTSIAQRFLVDAAKLRVLLSATAGSGRRRSMLG
jgi:hypothetical protein